MSKIKIDHISKIYNEGKENEVRALDDVSFELEEGEFVIILGPSGAGKSTLLNIIGCMDIPTSGDYFVGEDNVAKFKANELTMYRRESVGFVFQFYNLMPNLTALENVQLAAAVAPNAFEAGKVISDVGLERRASNFPSQMSGGEQQRTSIARAIVKNPKLLLCDEPTGALDSKTGASIISLLYRVSKEYKKTVIIVTHNSKIAECAHRLIRIVDGKIASNEIIGNPKKPEDIDW